MLRIQRRLIDEFGGSHGLLNEGSLDSALLAAANRRHYENADLAVCAATYAYHLTMAHAFVDGNKRIGAATSEVFLMLNGANLSARNDQLVDQFLRIAAGKASRNEVEVWFRQWIVEPNA